MQVSQTLQMLLGGLAHQPVLLGAWFGLVHALDADHLSTIGGLAVNGRAGSVRAYAIRWASGHALALSLIGGLVLGLGLWGLTAVSRYAELAVAATLVAIGAHALRRAVAERRAGGRARDETQAPRHTHRASWFMGVLHGGAGSASVLALVPLAAYGSLASSAAYLGAFSLGVGAGAVVFAFVFSRCVAHTRRAAAAFKGLVGLAAVAAGIALLFEQLHGGG